MPFKKIMKELVEGTPGAGGAIFVDWEGEAVEQYSLDGDSYRLKVIGAHKGVMLKLIDDAQKAINNDTVNSVTIRMNNFHVLMAPVKEGYFVAMTLDSNAVLSKGHYMLRKAVEALAKEM